ncbi:hypothetical protein GCM10009696_32680 [Kocuria himachalensis]
MTRNNDIETLLRKTLENANQDEHEEKLGDHQAPRQQARPIALNDDAALAAIVGAALNNNNF